MKSPRAINNKDAWTSVREKVGPFYRQAYSLHGVRTAQYEARRRNEEAFVGSMCSFVAWFGS